MALDKVKGFLKVRMLRSSWVMLIGFFLLMCLDFGFTFATGEYAQYLEHNPLYIMFKSWTLIIGLNFLAIWIILKANNHPMPLNRFLACNFFVWVSILRIGVIWTNIKTFTMVKAGEVSMQAAMAVPDSVKVADYSNLQMLVLYFPMFITLLVYGLFRLDNQIIRRWEA